jgi:Fe-S-cluster-containing dehydrogenase component
VVSRRNFLKYGLGAAAGAGLAHTTAGKIFAGGKGYDPRLRWAFLVDTYKCVGCGMCVRACKLENEIPYNTTVSRTWVERYVIKNDGSFLADSPMAARDGFITQEIGRGEHYEPETPASEDIAKAFFVPKLCNQCDKPACVQVCPVGATYQTPDGVVLIDRTWCIGCGYCIMACPYGVRFFHPVYKTAEKCNWCYHRISNGMKPACVDACPFGARRIGNYHDPEDPVNRIIRTQRVSVLKDEYGTGPMAFYLGLDRTVR